MQNTTDVEGIHVINISLEQRTITNEDGSFRIPVRKNDTLFFSSLKYQPQTIVISSELYERGTLKIILDELVNELDEVLLFPRLSGDVERDLRRIEIIDTINFYDVGIPGFQGVQEEKIPNLMGQVIAPTAVNLEGLYKYISGYYRKLKLRRKWDAENTTLENLKASYGTAFFWDAFQIPEERLQEFLLFCLETTEIERDFRIENYNGVWEALTRSALEYRSRLPEKEE
ncbi:hypothetical protein [Altibacter sp. HG106]|uniref:hypothetical protein n=1 Tax=Altibacter sp. HG106 TaxID=3023937 RepID=UPI002350AB01|nr:hypothetical protein [Altibacter sp. HG106]MDC7995882.1 hypothetical protein [Altibacter sp. HG106]